VQAKGAEITHEYSIGTFQAYALTFPESLSPLARQQQLGALTARAEVAFVEKDIQLKTKSEAPACDVQRDVPSWGIARTSETKLPLDGTYRYTDGVGADVDVYVLDTGVRVTHHEFEGRASFAFNAAGGKIDTDKDGHGTHVAGTVGAKHYGVCKECRIISVKIFKDNGDCTATTIINGLNFVFKHFNATRGTVINISVGGDPGETSDAIDAAVNQLVAAGVHVVGAAGNENVDACTESPARAKSIIAVGATMILTQTTDYFLGGSNFGKCVKMFAPGDKIVSLGIGSDTEVGVVDSGTSMATPHVAGTLAKFVSLNMNASLPMVQQMLFDSALDKVIQGVPKGTVNKLVHKGCL